LYFSSGRRDLERVSDQSRKIRKGEIHVHGDGRRSMKKFTASCLTIRNPRFS
jgi:hypothetical protein